MATALDFGQLDRYAANQVTVSRGFIRTTSELETVILDIYIPKLISGLSYRDIDTGCGQRAIRGVHLDGITVCRHIQRLVGGTCLVNSCFGGNARTAQIVQYLYHLPEGGDEPGAYGIRVNLFHF